MAEDTETLKKRREVVVQNLEQVKITYSQLVGQKILLDELIDGAPKIEEEKDSKPV